MARARAPSACRALATASLCIFLTALVAEHVVRSSLSPLQHQISEYANGQAGWLMTLAFAAWALSLLLTAVVLYPASRLAALGCGCAAGGLVVVACFHTQTIAGLLPPGITRTTQGRLHDVGGEVVSTGLLLAAIATAASPRFPRSIRVVAATLVATAVVTSVGLLAFSSTTGGARQRITILAACVWQALAIRTTQHALLPRAQP